MSLSVMRMGSSLSIQFKYSCSYTASNSLWLVYPEIPEFNERIFYYRQVLHPWISIIRVEKNFAYMDRPRSISPFQPPRIFSLQDSTSSPPFPDPVAHFPFHSAFSLLCFHCTYYYVIRINRLSKNPSFRLPLYSSRFSQYEKYRSLHCFPATHLRTASLICSQLFSVC